MLMLLSPKEGKRKGRGKGKEGAEEGEGKLWWKAMPGVPNLSPGLKVSIESSWP